jgi:hypothetical protein
LLWEVDPARLGPALQQFGGFMLFAALAFRLIVRL